MNMDTISAISTARGKGGVAMIRISGEDALSVSKKVFTPLSKKTKLGKEPRKVIYGNIIRDGVIIDDATLTYFVAPYSYTGEDVCEICCHGGLYVTQAVLEAVLSNGARLAEAGEFTKRAYINGKLSLSKAEAVGNIIDAVNDAQMRLSSSMMRGTLDKKLSLIRDEMLMLITRAYAVIDYPDEEIIDTDRTEMLEKLEYIEKELDKLKGSYRSAKAVNEGIKTAIVGRPNAGKSSLYNMISGEEKAIVTDIAGTTRDVIESTVSLGDVTLRLADTAGIRETSDTVEKIGVERAKEKMDEAELVFCVFDGSEQETKEDEFILNESKGKCAIAVINKSDKTRHMSDDFEEKIKKSFEFCVSISAENGDGAKELADIVNKMYALDKINLSQDAIVSNARQLSSVALALEKVREAKDALYMGESTDIVCFSLENALSELEMIDARKAGEEIVNSIFSHFCVGK